MSSESRLDRQSEKNAISEIAHGPSLAEVFVQVAFTPERTFDDPIHALPMGSLANEFRRVTSETFDDPYLREAYRLMYVTNEKTLEFYPPISEKPALAQSVNTVNPPIEVDIFDETTTERRKRQRRFVAAVLHSHSNTPLGLSSFKDLSYLFDRDYQPRAASAVAIAAPEMWHVLFRTKDTPTMSPDEMIHWVDEMKAVFQAQETKLLTGVTSQAERDRIHDQLHMTFLKEFCRIYHFRWFACELPSADDDNPVLYEVEL